MDNIDFNRRGGYKVKMRQPFLILGPPGSARTFLQQSLSMNGAGIYEPVIAEKLKLSNNSLLIGRTMDLDNIFAKLFTNDKNNMHPHLRDNLDKPFFIKECISPFLISALQAKYPKIDDLFDFILDRENPTGVDVPKTIWMFRDPLHMFASLKDIRDTDVHSTLSDFSNAVHYYDEMAKLYPETTVMVTHDDLMGNKKEHTLRQLCKFLDIEFTGYMLQPESEYRMSSHSRVYLTREQKEYEFHVNHHSTLKTGEVIDKTDLLSDEEISIIKSELTPLYERIVAERRALPSLEDDTQLIPSL